MTPKATLKKIRKPAPQQPREGKRREDPPSVRVEPLNPPGGGGVAKGDGPEKK